MIKTLNAQLPPLPEPMVVKQELPPDPTKKFKDIDKVTIGQPVPLQKVDKKNNQKVAPKKVQLKKGEKPPRVFQYNKE